MGTSITPQKEPRNFKGEETPRNSDLSAKLWSITVITTSTQNKSTKQVPYICVKVQKQKGHRKNQV